MALSSWSCAYSMHGISSLYINENKIKKQKKGAKGCSKGKVLKQRRWCLRGGGRMRKKAAITHASAKGISETCYYSGHGETAPMSLQAHDVRDFLSQCHSSTRPSFPVFIPEMKITVDISVSASLCSPETQAYLFLSIKWLTGTGLMT